MGLVALGLIHRALPSPLLHPLMLVLFAAVAVTDGVARTVPERDLRAAFTRGVLRVALLAAVLGGCLLVGLVLNAWGAFAWRPSLLLAVPGFALRALPIDLAAAVIRTSTMLFHDARGTTGIHPLMAALLVLEVLWPGRLVHALALLPARAIFAARRLDLRPTLGATPATVGAFVMCLGGVAVAWTQVIRAGYLMDASELMRFAGLLFRLAVVPLILAVLLLRSGPVRRLEERLRSDM